jgi:hypothetical protein
VEILAWQYLGAMKLQQEIIRFLMDMQEDEDEDLRAMEGAARTLNRADFETDEQFQVYKARKEAAPKAAFQFGVKVRSAPVWALQRSSFSACGLDRTLTSTQISSDGSQASLCCSATAFTACTICVEQRSSRS